MSEPDTKSEMVDDEVKKQKRNVFLYTMVIIVIGLGITFYSVIQVIDQLQAGFFLFIGMVLIAELSSVELFVSSRFSTVSVTSVIVAASIPVFGPAYAVLLMTFSGVVSGISTTFLRKDRPAQNRASFLRRMGFNVGMFAVSALAGGLTYALAGGYYGKLLDLHNLFPFLLSVVVLNVTNIFLLVIVIHLQTGRSPLHIWHQDFQWSVPITVLGGLVGGGGLALVYENLGVVGGVVLFLPILSMGYSFRLYQTNTKEYVNQLEAANDELNEANTGLLETLGAVIDAYDIYTYGHSSQVAVYARAIARAMGIAENEQKFIFRGALIHDIGKIGVTEAIIGKQGMLTEEEVQIMRRHPIIGADILRRTKGLQPYIPLVRHHHERWDGKGYPAGLAGDEIPLGARVIALADSIDAMSSDRPYRRGMSCEEVKAEVERNRGSQFDPACVDAYLTVIAEIGPEFFKNSAELVDHSLIWDGIHGINQTIRYIKRGLLATEVE